MQEECQCDAWGLKRCKRPYFKSSWLFAGSAPRVLVGAIGHKDTIFPENVSLWGFFWADLVCLDRRCLGWVTAAFVERAFVAKRFSLSAAGFGQLYDLRVVFVVEGDVFRECLHKKFANFIIALVALQYTNSFENAFCVGIDDERGPACSIKEN